MVSIGLALGAGGLNRLIRQQKESKDAAAKEAELLKKRLAKREDFVWEEEQKYDIWEKKEENERKYQLEKDRIKETISLVPFNVLGYNDQYSNFASHQLHQLNNKHLLYYYFQY